MGTQAYQCVAAIKRELAQAGTPERPDARPAAEPLGDRVRIVEHHYVFSAGYTLARGSGCVGVALPTLIDAVELSRLLATEGLSFTRSGSRTLWVFPAGTPGPVRQSFLRVPFPMPPAPGK